MKVFKYRGGGDSILKRDLKSLSKSQFYAAPIDSLNDPFEARVKVSNESFEFGKFLKLIPSFNNNENIKKEELALIKLVSEFIENSKSYGIYSLSKSYDDELLWAYYADSHKGFCIEYDLNKLKEYKIETEPSFTVRYRDEIPEITSIDILPTNLDKYIFLKKLLGTKSKRWEHEDEIRIVTGQTGLIDYDYRSLKCIYFGFRSEPKFQKLTMKILKGRGIKYYLMEPKEGSYKLNKKELLDFYDKAPAYLSKLSSIAKDTPVIDEAIKPFEELIHKAIEIVRREPYCEEVIDAYLSESKGSKSDPVFYVTYTRSDGLLKNFFISKSEIEKSKI